MNRLDRWTQRHWLKAGIVIATGGFFTSPFLAVVFPNSPLSFQFTFYYCGLSALALLAYGFVREFRKRRREMAVKQ